ncbi:MAG: hypothetical protein E7643_06035 [Ruminococcaceae bacterium]|nr:hypothetical protein [Oscillospiraceae bacterium]
MIREFGVYSPADVIASNLSESADRLFMLTEQEISHLYDLAHEVVDGKDVQEILASLPDQQPPEADLRKDVLLQNRELLSRLQLHLQSQRRILLCHAICDLLKKQRRLTHDAFFADTEHPTFKTNPRITYQKSLYTDSAYLQFSSFFKEPHVAYTHGFISACEDVYNGLCDYCILPLENSAEGLLGSFLKLILRYDLKIAATCDIRESGTNRVTRFALLRPSLLPLFEKAQGKMIFEISIPTEDVSDISDILSAASFFELPLMSVNYISYTGQDKHIYAHCAFSSESGALDAFLMYLSMEIPHYTPIGLYPHLSSKKERT